jgi:hypothetical protein
MSRPWRRLAIAGSVGWPQGPAWHAVVTDELSDYLLRMPENSTLYVRHGDADEGPDAIAHLWASSPRSALVAHMQGQAGPAIPNRADVEIIEERLPADWAACNPHCKEFKADGSPHRRPNPGYPDHPRRGHLPDYCPSAGHWRNPNVVGYLYDGPPNRCERKHYTPIPDARVSLLMAWNYNNSPGTSATVRHAITMGVPYRVWGAFG